MMPGSNPDPIRTTPRPLRALAAREAPLLGVMLLLAAAFALGAPGFTNPVNLAAIGRDIAVIGMLGVGLTLVVLTGGIDLSCASVLALSASVMGLLMDRTGAIALPVLACLGTAALLGTGNALLVTRMGVPPIVATLATLGLYRMQAMKMVTLISPLPPGFSKLGAGWAAFVAFLAVLTAAALALVRTPWGRHVYAAGGNATALRLSGVSVGRTVGWTYVASALCAGAAAVVASATLNSVQGNMFPGYELDAVAAVVLGGTAITGGRGGVIGTALGAGVMAILRNGLIVAGLDVYWYQAIIGAAILLTGGLDVAIPRLRARREAAG